MRRILNFIPLVVLFVVIGCGSSDDASREWVSAPSDSTAQTRKTSFETHTDTVTTRGTTQRQEQQSATESVPVRFMVQIGSYTDRNNASAKQTLARERYQLPVVNDYNAARRLYQVRIGFFETEQAAETFRLKLIADDPAQFKDAWIVLLTK